MSKQKTIKEKTEDEIKRLRKSLEKLKELESLPSDKPKTKR